MRFRAQMAACVVALLFCCLLSGCIREETTQVPTPGTPGSPNLAPLSAAFQTPAAALEPTAAQDPMILNQVSGYWLNATETFSLTWSNYSLALPCPPTGGVPASQTFPLNLCTPGCSVGGQPKSCLFLSGSSNPFDIPLPPMIAACQNWPANHGIILDSHLPEAARAPSNDTFDAYCVGTDCSGVSSNLNVWLLQSQCVNDACSSQAVPFFTRSWLWSQGCSPATISVPQAMPLGGDVLLQVWASRRADFAQNLQQSPPPQSDDQAGPKLEISMIFGTPRVDTTRIRFTETCIPGRCGVDPTESQWGAAMPPTEVYSNKLRVKQIRAFAAPTDADPNNPQLVPFCLAFLKGDESHNAQSTCVTSMGGADCSADVAALSSGFNRSPGDNWKISFSSRMTIGTPPVSCQRPNSDVWVEFTLEAP